MHLLMLVVYMTVKLVGCFFSSLCSVNRDRRSDVLCAVSSPKLNMVLKVWPYQCHLQGDDDFSSCWLHYWFYLIEGTWEEMFGACVGTVSFLIEVFK